MEKFVVVWGQHNTLHYNNVHGLQTENIDLIISGNTKLYFYSLILLIFISVAYTIKHFLQNLSFIFYRLRVFYFLKYSLKKLKMTEKDHRFSM